MSDTTDLSADLSQDAALDLARSLFAASDTTDNSAEQWQAAKADYLLTARRALRRLEAKGYSLVKTG